MINTPSLSIGEQIGRQFKERVFNSLFRELPFCNEACEVALKHRQQYTSILIVGCPMLEEVLFSIETASPGIELNEPTFYHISPSIRDH